jgi:glycosyltransferase involved in cell wall biosynthesis
LCGAAAERPSELTRESLGQLLGPSAARRLGWYPLPPGLRLSVVIPVYNERDTVREIIRRVQAVSIPKQIIVVDDGSTDGTRQVLAELEPHEGLTILYHERNRGKGAALRTGFAQAGGDIVIIQDADLEYNPQEYFRLIRPILEGKADVVYGSRFIGESHRVLLYWHYLGNQFLTLLSNMFTNLNLTDMETCYKVFRADLLKYIDVKSKRFGVEPELTAKFAKRHCRIYEIPISYAGRDYTEGKKIGWKDGFSAIWSIIKFRFVD